MTEFYDSRIVRSRAERKCDECRQMIPAGVMHRYIAMKQEGEFYTVRLCEPCQELRNAIWLACDLGDDEGPTVGEARAWVRDELDTPDPDAWLAGWKAERAAKADMAAEAARLIDRQTAATLGWTGEIPGHGGTA